MRVVVRNAESKHLCTADIDVPEDGTVRVCPLAGDASALFDYYFYRSGRGVIVEVGDLVVTGSLRTRWRDNHRVWWVDGLTPASLEFIPVKAEPAAGEVSPSPTVVARA